MGRGRKTVGVDVGSACLKLAVVDHSRGSPRLEQVRVRPLGREGVSPAVDGSPAAVGGGASGGTAAGRDGVSGAIRALFESEGLPGRDVVCGVGGGDVIVKTVSVDRAWEAEGPEAVRRQVLRQTQLDPRSVVTDVHLLDPGGESPRLSVLLAAARRKVVEARVELLEEAGLDPSVVDVEPLAVHNCLEYNHPEAMTGVAGVACVGHERTAISVMDDGTPMLVRHVSFGTRALRRTVAAEHGMSARESRDALRADQGAPDPAVGKTLRRRALELARALERTSEFLEERTAGPGPGVLWLCGGGAVLPHLREALAERLGIEVRGANPIQRLDHVPGALDASRVEGALPLLVPAVGMALRRSG